MKDPENSKTETTKEAASYWRKKLDAFMHDNPGKAFDIKDHEERARELRKVDSFEATECFDKRADFNAAAADRLPFPHAGKLKVDFRVGTPSFIHPLCDSEGALQPLRRLTADQVDEISQGNRPILEAGDERAAFIARWRFWRAWCVDRNPQLAFLPADTRIPDHTIWNHIGITSAFQGCLARNPDALGSLLLFSIGPVQSFIAAARNIRDLWSGSYLLSYLTSTALRVIAEELGPDHILFPSVWNQPLLDLQLRGIYKECKIRSDSDRTLWEEIWQDYAASRQAFLLPSLPNRFLAIVPSNQVDAITSRVESHVRDALKTIASAVSEHIDAKARRASIGAIDDDRFDRQVADFLEILWHAQPIPGSVEAVAELAKNWLPNSDAGPHPTQATLERLQAAWKSLPKGDLTSYGMLNASVAWPILTAVNAWGLDAIKNTRQFDAWNRQSSWDYGKNENKDSLTGREEAIFSAPSGKLAAQQLSSVLSGGNPNLLRPNERLGALTLIKRFWHIAYLSNPRYHDFKVSDFRMPDLHALSAGQPFKKQENERDDNEDTDIEAPEEDYSKAAASSYYAVLALDGDEMGKWISGEKLPSVNSRLAPKAKEYFSPEKLAVADRRSIDAFLNGARPLNPSFHLQFSEALGNFGQFAVRRIVEAFDGRLIYAGGDDVLALLPARSALACAQALRAAFRGDYQGLKSLCGAWKNGQKVANDQPIFARAPVGFIRLDSGLRQRGLAGSREPLNWDAMVPGPAADVSVGVAIGHYKSPLQDLIRAAQNAEKRAKHELGRSAIAVDIIKRSGEQVRWGTRWGNGRALGLLESLLAAGDGNKGLSSRFPYKLIERLLPYIPVDDCAAESPALDPDFTAILGDIAQEEFSQVLSREDNRKALEEKSLLSAFQAYWQEIEEHVTEPLARLHHLIGLLQTLAWIQKR